jgi:MORN repeat
MDRYSYDPVYLNRYRGRQHGKGRTSYANGDSHEGEYENGQKHGRGVYKCHDGQVDDGMFSKDMKDGWVCSFKRKRYGSIYIAFWGVVAMYYAADPVRLLSNVSLALVHSTFYIFFFTGSPQRS